MVTRKEWEKAIADLKRRQEYIETKILLYETRLKEIKNAKAQKTKGSQSNDAS
jgi:hypothetical protein